MGIFGRYLQSMRLRPRARISILYSLLSIPYLSSCGFSPMYKDGGRLSAAQSDIYIAPIEGTNGIDLRNHLIIGWNTANTGGERFKLDVKLNDSATIYKGLQRSGNATWEEIRVSASWTLSEKGRTIARSRETASESYTFVSDLVSASAAKTAAVQNAIRGIGEKIEMKINAKIKNTAAAPAKAEI